MTKIFRMSTLLALTFLLLFSTVAPYTYVSAEEPVIIEPTEMDSVTLDPGEGVFIKRNKQGYGCGPHGSAERWKYKLNLTSIGGTLDYAFVSRSLGNSLDENGTRIEDKKLKQDWDYSKGGMAYQKNQTNPNLIYFEDEVLNVTNMSNLPMKLEWVKSGENDHLVHPYYKDEYGSRDCGLHVENHGIPALTEHIIKPNEVYEFTKNPLDASYEDGIFFNSRLDTSYILGERFSTYIATPITGEGEVKFDVSAIKYSYYYANGMSYYTTTNSPVIIPDAQQRYGHTKYGKYFLTVGETSDITRERSFNKTWTSSMKIKNTGRDNIVVTVPYGILTTEKLTTSDFVSETITLKPKERLAYKVSPQTEGTSKLTILGDKIEDNYFTWGRRNILSTSEQTISFKDYYLQDIPKSEEKDHFITNVSDHDLTITYPSDHVDVRRVFVYEDINIISSSIKTNRASSFLSASGDTQSLVSDPVDTATGAFTSTTDTLSSKGVSDLTVPLKYYSSFTQEEGAFGKGWETDYTAKIQSSSESVKIRWTQNRFNDYILKEGSTNEYVGADDSTKYDSLIMTDTRYGDGVLIKKDGSKWTFRNGYLLSIIDRTGKTISIEYGSYWKIEGIKDASTGKYLRFKYPDYSSLVSEIYDETGRKVKLTYNSNKMISSVTDPNGNITTYDYDEEGRIVSSMDNEDNLLFFNTYDDKGRVIKQENNGVTTFSYSTDEETGYQTTEVTDRNRNKRILVHNTNLKLIKVIDENTNFTEKHYDIDGNVIELTDENGNKTSFTYDTRGNVLTSVDSKGTETLFTYDEKDNLTSSTVNGTLTGKFTYENNLITLSEDRFGNKASYTYNANKQVETITSPDGGTKTHTYEKGLLKTITDPTGIVTTYEHDKTGRLTATIDAEGNRTELTYDNNGNLTSTKDVLGNVATIIYDSRNRKTSETDVKGNTTTYTYDTNNNVKTVTDTLGNTTTNDYNLEDQLTKTTDAKGNVTEFIRDDKGQIIAVKDPLGNTISTQYDKVGNIISSKDAYDITVQTTEYDELNRPTRIIDALNNVSNTEYNEWSDVTKMVNASNQTTQFDYYDIGLVNKVTDANSGVATQDYDTMNRQSSFTDANGNTTSFTYDLAGRITSTTLQNGSTVTYEYNILGYLNKTTNARGQEFTYEYDSLGRLVKTTKPEGIIETSYDSTGNVLTKTDENGTVSYEYDNLNRPILYTDVFGNKLEYTYDKNSNVTELKYPDGKTVEYTYNANNQLETVSDWGSRTTTYRYDKNGRLVKTDRPNDTYELREYDIKGQLTKLGNYKPDSSILQETNFEYNALGVVVSETTHNGTETGVKNYTYDDLNRVINADGTIIGNSEYSYDAQGNILGVTKDDLTLEYGENNWLTSVNNETINYDVDGNALQTILNDNLVNLVYDSLNRLVDSGDTRYTYDVNNNRIKMQDLDDVTQFVVNPISQYSQVLLETDDTGRILKRYIYGIGLIGEETPDNDYITYHYDYRGSTTLLTDSQGEVVKEFEYGAYGELLTDSEGYHFLYNGRDGVQTDKTGLYYMRARYYNPNIKRFINQDILLGTILDSTSLNRYTYVNGNPISLIDPFGLEAQYSNNRRTLFEDIASLPKNIKSLLKGYDTAVKIPQRLIWDVKFLHYNRNLLNTVIPTNPEKAEEYSWDRLKDSETVYHRVGKGNENNSKYVSKDGHGEVVFNSKGKVVLDPINVGTYNYRPPTDALGHMVYDVVPYYILGNSPYDTTTFYDRVVTQNMKFIQLKNEGR